MLVIFSYDLIFLYDLQRTYGHVYEIIDAHLIMPNLFTKAISIFFAILGRNRTHLQIFCILLPTWRNTFGTEVVIIHEHYHIKWVRKDWSQSLLRIDCSIQYELALIGFAHGLHYIQSKVIIEYLQSCRCNNIVHQETNENVDT